MLLGTYALTDSGTCPHGSPPPENALPLEKGAFTPNLSTLHNSIRAPTTDESCDVSRVPADADGGDGLEGLGVLFRERMSELTPDSLLTNTTQHQSRVLSHAHAYYTQRRAGHAANNNSERSTATLRSVEMREMLVYVERELAECREECARWTAEAESLRANLAQEQASSRRVHSDFEELIRKLREENAEHVEELMEQIVVLKRLSESAFTEKKRVDEDAAQQKQQFVALLDRERREKQEIMDSYRQQTEALIAEQGWEITSLREAVNSSREECERLLSVQQDMETKLQKHQEQVADAEAAIAKERADAENRLREVKQMYTRRMEELLSRNEDITARMEKDAVRHQEWRREVLEQERVLAERLRAQEETHMKEQESLKEFCVQELARLQEKVKGTQSQLEEAQKQLEENRQKSLKGEGKVAQALQQALGELRQEKESITEEMLRQREEAYELHWGKLNQLQNTIDTLRRHLADESAKRSSVEEERNLVTARANDLQATVTRLTNDMEALQADYRARERAAAQELQSNHEMLRAQLRDRTDELEDLQQQLLQRELEERRLRDDVSSKLQALQSLRLQNKRQLEEVQRVADEREREACERYAALEKNMSALRLQKTQSETECQRLQHALLEAEALRHACERHLEDERQALRVMVGQLQESRDAAEENRTANRRAHVRQQELEEELCRKNSELDSIKEKVAELEALLEVSNTKAQCHVREAADMMKAHEMELQQQKQKHEEQIASLRLVADELREDIAKVHESTVSKDEELRRLREEVCQLRHDADTRVESWQHQLSEERELHEDDVRRLDEVLNVLRADLHRAQTAKSQCLKEVTTKQHDAERQRAHLQEMLRHSEAAKERLQEESSYREQLNSELQGTVRLLSSRLATYEDELRRFQEEVAELNAKLHETHTLIGRKDATIGQLTARLRAYETRMGV
uniref:Uncharacterized protein n=1 Tax=Trypanosoma congolense (strain IL3000) TaxID=1068625 RepID=G0USD4_TRYCI|nr:conserved hypothetical protein [Trypanosoma congolense IL3000]